MKHEPRYGPPEMSLDGRRVLTLFEKKALLWDFESDEKPTELASLAPRDEVLLSPDGSRILTILAKRACLLEVEAPTRRIPLGDAENCAHPVRTAMFSPDGSRLLSIADSGKSMSLWDGRSGRLQRVLEYEGSIDDSKFSADGKWILSRTTGQKLLLWETDTGRRCAEFGRDDHTIADSSISGDGKRVITISNSEILVWDDPFDRPAELTKVSYQTRVWLSPCGRRALTFPLMGNAGGTARLWDLPSRRILREVQLSITGTENAAVSPDGRQVVTVDEAQSVQLWDTETGQPLGPPFHNSKSVSGAQFTRDGKQLMMSTLEGQVTLFHRLHPRLPEDIDMRRLELWIEVMTNRSRDSQEALVPLSKEDWIMKRRELDQLGGPPVPFEVR